ncbi:mitotic control protein dis3 [Meredithblackwellia eburnea MCA 4105]
MSGITISQSQPLTTSFWSKSNKTGKLSKIQRQHYLRPFSSFPPLPTVTDSHWLVPDTNTLLHQLDLLSHPDFPLPLLIPQTVWDEVRHRSLVNWNRLKKLVQEDRTWGKAGETVWNEASEELFLKRQDNESPNDRNDRAIRHLCSFLSTNLPTISSSSGPPSKRLKTSNSSSHQPLRITLLTNDQANLSLSRQSGLTALTVPEFVASITDVKLRESLEEVVAVVELESSSSTGKAAAGNGTGGRKRWFEPHLPPSVLAAGLESGKFKQGHFRPSPHNFKEATVTISGSGSSSTPSDEDLRKLLVVGMEDMNRAMEGDLVVVEVLGREKWKGEEGRIVDEDSTDDPEDPDIEPVPTTSTSTTTTTTTTTTTSPIQLQPTARVLGILKRSWRPYVCHLPPTSSSLSSTAQSLLAHPLSRLIPRIRITTRQSSFLTTQKFIVSIDSWTEWSRNPEGHFVRSLGEKGSKEGEVASLLEEWEVPFRPFSSGILSCLPKEGESWVVPPKPKEGEELGVWRGREDLRGEIVCSIDPPGCQDIDDALHAKRLPNGNIEAGVHIADVSHFVHPDNPMDAEAASRGTTVYLVDKRIDMLPSLLGTNLCSLRPYVERLAFSVIWELDNDANIVDVRFTKSVIASKEAFTYEAAQRRKDDLSLKDPLTEGIRLLNTLAIKLRAARMKAGALNLASPEVKIHMESSESTAPVDVEQKELFETNSLVEEFMLLANISVAKRIWEQFPQTAVLRRHAPPPKTNFEVLQDVLMKRRGLALDVSSSRALADSLDKCVDPELPSFNTLVRIMATRCMLSAEYFCSGSLSQSSFTHYGLASSIYTHFTSPIRRYADVLVHRQLAAAISSTPLHVGLQTRGYVEKTLEVVNKRHGNAQKAGRASVEFFTALAIEKRAETEREQGKEGIREEAWVIRAFSNGLSVFVSRFGLEGLITFEKENEFDPDHYEVALPSGNGDGKKVKIGVFDKVVVDISVETDKNTQRGKVVMTLVEPVSSRGL